MSARGPAILGLYAILDVSPQASSPRATLAAFAQGGADVVQIRAKGISDAELLALATEAVRLFPGRVIINDRVDIALLSGAAGVHLGQRDLPVARARQIAPALAIGLSCHNADELSAGLQTDADYFGYGPVFATRSKAQPDPVVGLEGLAEAARASARPIVAIGGLGAETIPSAIRAGAAAVAVIADLVSHGDVAARTALLVRAARGP